MHITNLDAQNLTSQQFDELKIDNDILKLPYTAENGIRFAKSELPRHFMYSKGNCKGTIQKDNAYYGGNQYGLIISSTAYWTHIFGDTRGSVQTYWKNGDTTETVLERLSKEIAKQYKSYHKF